MNYLLRSRLLLSIVLFIVNYNTVDAHGRYNVQSTKGHALLEHTFLNLTDTPMHMERCLAKCLQDCRCMSFQICNQILCQLCSTDGSLNPSALKEKEECNHFSFQRDYEKAANQQCQEVLFPDINCCLTSNPCQNNGLCEPNTPTNQARRRFRCKCPPGYYGNLCQHPVKSCRGYVNGSRVPGKYKVFDANMNLFEVFCDFDTHSTMAWTLIQSYQLQLRAQCSFTFAQDHPVNENSSVWDSYRLSKSRMQSIQEDSSKWRMTCRYDTDGLNYTDYVRGSNDKRNILTYDGVECQELEFIDIRGYSCTDCTAGGAQRPSEVWHFDSLNSHLYCSFKPMNSFSCGGIGEDNFGWYGCQNAAHRCSSSLTSTSQTWFGNEYI